MCAFELDNVRNKMSYRFLALMHECPPSVHKIPANMDVTMAVHFDVPNVDYKSLTLKAAGIGSILM